MTAAAERKVAPGTGTESHNVSSLHFWLKNGVDSSGSKFEFATGGSIYTLCSPERARDLKWGFEEERKEDPQEGEIWLKIVSYTGLRDQEVVRIIPGQKIVIMRSGETRLTYETGVGKVPATLPHGSRIELTGNDLDVAIATYVRVYQHRESMWGQGLPK